MSKNFYQIPISEKKLSFEQSAEKYQCLLELRDLLDRFDKKVLSSPTICPENDQPFFTMQEEKEKSKKVEEEEKQSTFSFNQKPIMLGCDFDEEMMLENSNN